MSDAEVLRSLAEWLVDRSHTLGREQVGTEATANDLRRIADNLGERDRIAQMYSDARADLSAAERERADAIARANAALIKAGDEAGRLREELERAYAAIGRDYLERLRLAALEDR